MTTTNLRKKAKQYGIKGYTKMSKEELFDKIYKENQTDGAFLVENYEDSQIRNKSIGLLMICLCVLL